MNAIYETDKVIQRSDKDFGSTEIQQYKGGNLDYDDQTPRFRINENKIVIPNATEIIFTIKEEAYKQIVENAYNYSSKILLNLLLKEHKLMDRLR